VAAHRLSSSGSSATTTRSALLRRSQNRSAALETGSGLPPTARLGTACLPVRNPISVRRYATARATPNSPRCGWRPYGESSLATASTTRASCNPTGPCRRSAASALQGTRGPGPLSGIRGPRGTATGIRDDHRRQASASAGLGCESSGCSTAGRTRRASGSLGRHIPDHQALPGAGRHR